MKKNLLTIFTFSSLIFLAVLENGLAENISFETQRLTDEFHSEGAYFGRFNDDAHRDIVSGPFWYEGPAFTNRHRIYEGEAFNPKAYSKNFLCHAYDIDGNGLDDVLVLGFPGDFAYWFQNPGKKGGLWPRYNCFKPLENESPTFTDITGDGKPEIICSANGVFGYASPDWSDPTQLWQFTPVSGKITGSKFTHGLGVGDVNGDGRMDLMHKGGWLEHPEDPRRTDTWKHHIVPFTKGGGSQMYAYDFDGDGDNDVLTSLAAHAYGFAWHEAKKDGQDIVFTQRLILGSKPEQKPFGVNFSQTHAVSLADVDGDGIKDIVTGKRWYAHGGKDPGGKDPAVIYWFKTVRKGAPGEVEFVPHLIHEDSGVGTQVETADINGDALPDIIVGNKKGTFVHLQKRGAEKSVEAAPDADGFLSLFDGKTLKGWEGPDGWWEVKDGAIVAEATPEKPLKKNVFLFWRGGQLEDFVLKLDFRLTGSPKANSGIQFRSQEEADFAVKGYQADIDHGKTWLGCLYDEHARGMLCTRGSKVEIHENGKRVEVKFSDSADLGKHYKKEEWNEYQIKAVGAEIELHINGQLMSHVFDNETGQRDLSGALALQLHSGPPSKIEFKNIRLKNLKK